MIKSGVTGVHRYGDRWVAGLINRRNHIHIGVFPTLQEAANARFQAANELFGEFTHSSQRILV